VRLAGVSGRQDLIPRMRRVGEPRLAAYFCQALVGAGRFVVISRFWVVALGLLAVVASCTSGSGAGSKVGSTRQRSAVLAAAARCLFGTALDAVDAEPSPTTEGS